MYDNREDSRYSFTRLVPDESSLPGDAAAAPAPSSAILSCPVLEAVASQALTPPPPPPHTHTHTHTHNQHTQSTHAHNVDGKRLTPMFRITTSNGGG